MGLMNKKLIVIYIPSSQRKKAEEILKNHSVEEYWYDSQSAKKGVFRVLLESTKTQALLDLLSRNFYKCEGFRAMVLTLEASIPRDDPKEEEKKPVESARELPDILRISREELYAKIIGNTRLTWIYALMIIISSLVASIGLLRNSVTLIIGAMVIAPLLGPNVALAFSTTLADREMAKASLKTLLTGIFIALLVAVMIGFVIPVNPHLPEVKARTLVSYSDIILALAAGIAGVLSYISGLSTTLIGVMVAVALLPPLVNFGLLLGSGHISAALSSMLLFFTNLICVNLAGVVTLILSGVKPRAWWEAKKARRMTRIAILFWALLVLLLFALIYIQKTAA